MAHFSPEQTKQDLGIEESPPPSGSVDLSNYYTKDEVNTALAGATGADLSAYYTKAQIDTIAAAKIAIDSTVNDLNSTDATKPLSAAQGKALKILIDNIMTLVGSDNTNLDTIQEIVDFIELNKATLDTLGIGNIAGLQNALNAKADAGHNHDTSYYTKSQTDTALAGKSDTTHVHVYPGYSTSEVLLNRRWINGKPLYRKTILCGQMNIATGVTLSVAHGIANIEAVTIDWGKSGICNSPTGIASNFRHLNDFTPGSTASNAWLWVADATNIVGYSGYNRVGWYAFVTLEYTKTTDTASSPVAP